MIHTGSSKNMILFICNAVMITLLVIGVFSLVYLRSSAMKLEYNLGDLEKAKMNYLRERKTLLAEKARLISLEKFDVSSDEKYGFIFPDRMRVIHVNRQKESLPYKASLEKR